MQEAQALSSLTLNLAELTGPAIATALVLGVGAGWAFLLDAATFVVSATLLLRVRTPGTRARRRASAAPCSASSREGFREVSSRPWLWVTVVVFSLAVPLGYAPLFVLGPTIAKETYDSAAVFGIVTAAYGAGALIGALIGLRWRPAPSDAGGVPRDRGVAADDRRRSPWARPWRSSAARRSATGMGFALFEVLLGHHDGGADPAARALPRERLGVDGLAGPAAGRLSRWPARPPRPRAPRR